MSRFLEFFKKGLQMVETVLPFLTPILALIPGMQLPAAGLVILNAVPVLCHTAEELIGEGSGEAKKDLVITMANAAIQTMQKISSGGQKETWDKVSQLIGPAIELAVNNAKIIQAATDTKKENKDG